MLTKSHDLRYLELESGNLPRKEVIIMHLDANRIQQVEQYENPAVVRMIEKKMEVNETLAEELFRDVKKFLLLAAHTDSELAPPLIVDKAWHVFILFTKEYAEFCEHFLGRFIHHVPTEEEGSEWMKKVALETHALAQHTFGNSLSAYWRDPATFGGCKVCIGCRKSTAKEGA